MHSNIFPYLPYGVIGTGLEPYFPKLSSPIYFPRKHKFQTWAGQRRAAKKRKRSR